MPDLNTKNMIEAQKTVLLEIGAANWSYKIKPNNVFKKTIFGTKSLQFFCIFC